MLLRFLWIMHQFLYLTSGRRIFATLSPLGDASSLGNVSLFLHHLWYVYQVWEIHHGLLMTGGIYSIFSTQVARNENFSPPDLWNIIITCTPPLGNGSLFPPHLLERHQCLHLTCGKCFIISTSLMANASFSQPNLWECFIVSTSTVRNASFSLQKISDMYHCHYF